jgi:hypothetical protein
MKIFVINSTETLIEKESKMIIKNPQILQKHIIKRFVII